MQLFDINEIRKIVLPKHHFHIERNRNLALESPKEEFKNVLFATVKYNIFIKIQSSHSLFVSVITKTKKAQKVFARSRYYSAANKRRRIQKIFAPKLFNLELSNFIDYYLIFAVPPTVSNTLMVSISNRAYINGAKNGRTTQFKKHRIVKNIHNFTLQICIYTLPFL